MKGIKDIRGSDKDQKKKNERTQRRRLTTQRCLSPSGASDSTRSLPRPSSSTESSSEPPACLARTSRTVEALRWVRETRVSFVVEESLNDASLDRSLSVYSQVLRGQANPSLPPSASQTAASSPRAPTSEDRRVDVERRRAEKRRRIR